MKRRASIAAIGRLIACAGASAFASGANSSGATDSPRSPAQRYPAVVAGRALSFPRDFGAHPEYRTEWWYITGWLRSAAREIGVQITFFRSRTGHDDRNPSRFAPKQLILAHAAIAVAGNDRLRHDQRAARTGFGLASAAEDDCDLRIGDWTLARSAQDRYLARIDARDFALDLAFDPGSPPFPQGDAGYSRKGPRPQQASYYYSRPQVAVTGNLRISDRGTASLDVEGTAWLDHEWSSELLDERASGWDWIGLNFDDGSALMAFRIRTREGDTIWSHARWLGEPKEAARPRFEPIRTWRSLRSGATYPVEMRVSVADRGFELKPLFDDQELDTRASTGTIYWEGAVRVFERGREVGRGYLELTGYAGAVRF